MPSEQSVTLRQLRLLIADASPEETKRALIAAVTHYSKLAEAESHTIFGGRLGTYRYLDMHQAIGSALKVFENVIAPHFTEKKPVAVEVSSIDPSPAAY